MRGGAGLFSGRPIYLYFSDDEGTGLDFRRLHCIGDRFRPSGSILTTSTELQEQGPPPQPFQVNYFNPAFASRILHVIRC